MDKLHESSQQQLKLKWAALSQTPIVVQHLHSSLLKPLTSVISDLQYKDVTHAWHLHHTTHLRCTDCSLWHLPALKHSSKAKCLPAAKTTVHTHYLLGRSAAVRLVLQKAKKAMCVRLTKPGSVKQQLNLSKQALAWLPDCLPAVWAWAWTGGD